MSNVKQLLSMADLDEVLAHSHTGPVVIFKHSTTCPVSARAHQEWQAFLAAPEAAGVSKAFVRVIEERSISLTLAERVGVTHASPQALVVRNGQGTWNTSHFSITVDALKAAVKG